VPDLNQIAVFERVVRDGSFTAAARSLGLAKSTVSERIASLEERLGVRLLQRTTRTMRLTDDGAAYLDRCTRVLAELREAEDALRETQVVPSGLLRVTAPRLFGHAFLAATVAEYLQSHPQVRVELMLAERQVDLVEEGFDVAVRLGRLGDSTLRQRTLGAASMVHVASPAYLARVGTPEQPEELQSHDVIAVGDGTGVRWPFVGPEGPKVLEIQPRLLLNSLVMARQAALDGAGVAWIPGFLARDAVQSGALLPVLAAWAPPPLPITALVPGGRFVNAKVRAFLDLLVERVGAESPWDSPDR
jgi:DNA-binding transcriptional LysR family regulator